MKKLLVLGLSLFTLNCFAATPKYKVGDCREIKDETIRITFLKIIQPNYRIQFVRNGKAKLIERNIEAIDELFTDGENKGILTECEN